MNTVTDIILILSTVTLAVGLIRPTALTNKKGNVPTRKGLGIGFGIIIVICLVVLAANAPKQPNTHDNANKAHQAAASTDGHVSSVPTQQTTATSGAAPATSTSNKASVLTKMNTIQADLNGAWQYCQGNPSCQGKITAISDYQKLYDDNSANFSGKAADDFSGWRTDIGMVDGDMKQWAINESFNRPSGSLTTATINREIQNVQGDISSFSND